MQSEHITVSSVRKTKARTGGKTPQDGMRDEYLAQVSVLFRRIQEWLRDQDPRAKFSSEKITIHEEQVAPYKGDVLVISRPGYKTIRLIPRGRWILGADGRVDLKSDLGTETLLYLSDSGPVVRISEMTESGKKLPPAKSRTPKQDIAEGWVFLQNRQVGLMPTLDADLCYRLLEVLGR